MTHTLDVADGDAIDDALESVPSGATIDVPPGTYRLPGNLTVDADDFEVRGNGATLVPERTCILSIDGDGWAFGGFRIENDGERDVRWAPDGDGWRLHHLGWENECGLPKWNVYPRCPRGGEATLDSLYFGEGASVASSYVFVYDGTDGVVNVENCYMDQGGVYGVDSRRPPEATGVTRFRNCFFRDGYLACLRTGSPDRVAVVDGCVFVYSEDPERAPASDWDDHGNVTGGKRNHRCVWAWWGEVEVRNCAMTNPHGGGIVAYAGTDSDDDACVDRVVARNNNIDAAHPFVNERFVDHDGRGSAPRQEPPPGVPTSASEAANAPSGR